MEEMEDPDIIDHIYYNITIGQLGITQQVNWEMQQISATARSGPVS